MKPISSGVACSAAKMMSPSFSRSSSSTTTTARPAAIASTAVCTLSRTLAASARRGATCSPECAESAWGTPANAVRRCTYLASASVSRFTLSPTLRAPRLVAFRVSGIRPTSNHAGVSPGSETAVTVRDTPETAMEPFSASRGASSVGRLKRRVLHASCAVTDARVPTASTWPCTT